MSCPNPNISPVHEWETEGKGFQLGDSSLNPARSLGPALLVGGGSLSILWVFVVGPIIGGLIGWGLYRAVYAD